MGNAPEHELDNGTPAIEVDNSDDVAKSVTIESRLAMCQGYFVTLTNLHLVHKVRPWFTFLSFISKKKKR